MLYDTEIDGYDVTNIYAAEEKPLLSVVLGEYEDEIVADTEPKDEPNTEPKDEPQDEPEDEPQDEPEDEPQDEPEDKDKTDRSSRTGDDTNMFLGLLALIASAGGLTIYGYRRRRA